ncbi:hypothetical protein P8631_16985, partial [Guyparkeria sp. 1SP6A2]|nr:hypothetical protein [Guyparkeria sp. 1SP6A2]
RPTVPPQSQGYDDRYQGGQPGYGNSPEPGYDSGYNTGQVYGGGAGGGGGRGGGGDAGYVQGRPPVDWRRRIKLGALTLVVVLLVVSVSTYFS